MEKTPSTSNEVVEHLSGMRNRDAFQEVMLSVSEFIENNAKAVVGAIVALVLLAVGFVGWRYIESRIERSAQEKFYPIEKEYTAKRDQFDRAKYFALSGQPVPKEMKEKPVAATGDIAKDYGPIVDRLEGFAADHKGTAAGAQAAIAASEIRLSYNQTEQAIKAIEPAAKATKSSTLMGALTRMSQGNAYAAASQCDQAIAAWDQVMKEKGFAFLHGEAALRSGLCLEKAGQKDRAIEMYRKAAADTEKSGAAQTARSLLRALELGT